MLQWLNSWPCNSKIKLFRSSVWSRVILAACDNKDRFLLGTAPSVCASINGGWIYFANIYTIYKIKYPTRSVAFFTILCFSSKRTTTKYSYIHEALNSLPFANKPAPHRAISLVEECPSSRIVIKTQVTGLNSNIGIKFNRLENKVRISWRSNIAGHTDRTVSWLSKIAVYNFGRSAGSVRQLVTLIGRSASSVR